MDKERKLVVFLVQERKYIMQHQKSNNLHFLIHELTCFYEQARSRASVKVSSCLFLGSPFSPLMLAGICIIKL